MRISTPSLFVALAVALALTSLPAPALTTNIISVADTGLHEHDPNNNLGGMLAVRAGTINQGTRSRALFKFDVAGSLPAGATVTSVTLSLVVPNARATGLDFKLHRMLKDWGEGVGDGQNGGLGAPAAPGEATWYARFYSDITWAAPGGAAGADFAATASATNAMGASSLEFSSDEMAADVQMWLDSAGTNFGWLVMIADEGPVQTASHLSAREDSGNAPLLTIEYTVASPPAPAAPPTLFAAALTGNQIRFSFNAESNRTYAVEFRDSLTTTNWSVLANIPAQPANTTVHFTNDTSVAERYFRARTP